MQRLFYGTNASDIYGMGKHFVYKVFQENTRRTTTAGIHCDDNMRILQIRVYYKRNMPDTKSQKKHLPI